MREMPDGVYEKCTSFSRLEVTPPRSSTPYTTKPPKTTQEPSSFVIISAWPPDPLARTAALVFFGKCRRT